MLVILKRREHEDFSNYVAYTYLCLSIYLSTYLCYVTRKLYFIVIFKQPVKSLQQWREHYPTFHIVMRRMLVFFSKYPPTYLDHFKNALDEKRGSSLIFARSLGSSGLRWLHFGT